MVQAVNKNEIMLAINLAIVGGYIGNEPRITTTKQGVKCAMFSVATTEKGYKKRDGTEIPDRTEWHNVVLWNKQAEFAEKWLHKGDGVIIRGKLSTRQYKDKNGTERTFCEINAEDIQIVSVKPQQQATTQQVYNNDLTPF